MTRRKAFFLWSWGFSFLWVLANTPRVGYFRDDRFWFYQAGCPFIYGRWSSTSFNLIEFYPWGLASNFAAWLVLIGLAWLCAWSRRERAHSGPGPNPFSG